MSKAGEPNPRLTWLSPAIRRHPRRWSAMTHAEPALRALRVSVSNTPGDQHADTEITEDSSAPHTIPDPERGGLSRRVPPSPPHGHRRIAPQTTPGQHPDFRGDSRT